MAPRKPFVVGEVRRDACRAAGVHELVERRTFARVHAAIVRRLSKPALNNLAAWTFAVSFA
jgi:hypothetical protein